jgi:CheY-like chemotaxis protein
MKNSENLTILWLDDEPREILAHVDALEHLGFRVTMTKSSAEAIHEATLQDFDMIVTDLLMPPPDGIDFLKTIRPICPQAMLVVFTAYPYNNLYRQHIRDLPFRVAVFEKLDMSARDFAFRTMELFAPELPKLKPQKKSLWAKLVASVDIKPGVGGVAVDLKKLLE